jgi:imidazolonepropionase
VSALLIDGIGVLVTNDPAVGDGQPLGAISDGSVVVEDGRIAWLGTAAGRAPVADRRIDLGGRCLLPGFVDSHAHLVFAGDRVRDFAARMAGTPYLAAGIASTVAATRAASEPELTATVARLVAEAHRSGTTTIEIKSGYGLTVADEVRSLAVAARFTAETTYLGAHLVPPEFDGRRDAYVELVSGEMLIACAPYARWVDVFCERGAFDADEARTVLTAGASRGLLPRVHGNQLGPGPGAQLAVEVGAASVDHCTYLSDADVAALAGSGPAGSGTVATLLPGVEFSTRSPYPDARRLLAAGVTLALATDCNPGTSYTSSMPFCIALAVREMGMTPDEALWAATAGGAAALRRTDIGVLRPGARADLAVLDAPSPAYLAYRPGVALVSPLDPARQPGGRSVPA